MSFLGGRLKRRKTDRHEFGKVKSEQERSESYKISMTEGGEFDVDILRPEKFSPEAAIRMGSVREPQDESAIAEGQTSDIPMHDMIQPESTASNTKVGNPSVIADESNSQLLGHLEILVNRLRGPRLPDVLLQ